MTSAPSFPQSLNPPLREGIGSLLFLGTPLRMEEQGHLLSVEDWTEESSGFPEFRAVSSTPAPGVRASWRQVSCGVQGKAWALSG